MYKDIADPQRFHALYGVKIPRIAYRKSDFIDYALMTLLCAAVISVSYERNSCMSIVGLTLCALMIITFLLRHGLGVKMPVILRRPQDMLYMVAYKAQNMAPMYFVAVGVFSLDNYFISLTPGLAHRTELMHEVAIYLFYSHFFLISIYRSVILAAHLYNGRLVREVLLQTSWKGSITKQPNISLHILHAYFTGLLTHLILIAPWYLLITHFKYSLITLPLVCLINIVTHASYIKGYNAWFYRDHWLGHNSEFEFLYLHGTHHDAIPSGLIGVSGNGHLEGFLRHSLGNPTAFYSPVIAFLLYTIEVVQDINGHQYIPGIFPRRTRQFHEVTQHSTHHWGRLEPYSIGFKMGASKASGDRPKRFKFPPNELLNSISLDEQLTGFEWDNSRHRHFLALFDKYQS